MPKKQIDTNVWTIRKNRRCVTWDTFVPETWESVQINRRGDTICKDFISLDTETAHNHNKKHPIGWMYQWAFTYGDVIVYGRKPSELVAAFDKIIKANNLGCYAVGEDGAICHKMVVYVHNLSYDYEYVKDWLKRTFAGLYKSGESNENMLAINTHNIISYEIAGILFKCSFKLTHKSLDDWAKDIGAEAQKKVGAIDYERIYYQDDDLTDTHWDYMFYDVIVLDECLRRQMMLYKDDLTSIPLTVTSYVRREMRQEFSKDKANRNGFLRRQLNAENYKMCRQEFAGGFTHGNRFYAERTVKGRIRHRDFRSHYPSQIRYYTFPVGKPILAYDNRTHKTAPPTLKQILAEKDKCVLVRIAIIDPVLVDNRISMPYLQACKLHEGAVGRITTIEDNGRVLKMTGISEIVVNEDDLAIILKQYKFKYTVIRVVTMKRGKVPQYIIDVIDKYFKNKTDFKDLKAEMKAAGLSNTKEYLDVCNNLMIAKGMVNGIYGMFATDPIRTAYYEDDAGEWRKDAPTEDEIPDLLKEYYSVYNHSHFLDYQFGLWTTSHARRELLTFCELVGWDNVLYCDTDSIFYISTDEIEGRINRANERLRAHAEEIGAFIIDNKGNKVHYNQFDDENEDIVEFRFLHAKCYAYVEIKNGKRELHCTIAGVKKRALQDDGTYFTREDELQTIENLKSGMTFTVCGGIEKKHIFHAPCVSVINGHETEYASSIPFFKSQKKIKSMLNAVEDFVGWQEDIHLEIH